jgi:hypothetical protein
MPNDDQRTNARTASLTHMGKVRSLLCLERILIVSHTHTHTHGARRTNGRHGGRCRAGARARRTAAVSSRGHCAPEGRQRRSSNSAWRPRGNATPPTSNDTLEKNVPFGVCHSVHPSPLSCAGQPTKLEELLLMPLGFAWQPHRGARASRARVEVHDVELILTARQTKLKPSEK